MAVPVGLAAYILKDRIFELMGVSAVFFLLFALAIRFTLPRIFRGPGVCRKCGYDIRGSLAFHRCPECGTPLNEHVSSESQEEHDSKGRVSIFLQKHPTTPLLVFIVLLLIPRFYAGLRTTLRIRHWQASLKSIGVQGGIDLAQAANFAWDEVVFVPPYSTCNGIQQALAIPFQDCPSRFGTLSDWTDQPLALFIRDQDVVEVLPGLWSGESCPLVRVPRDRAPVRLSTEGKCLEIAD
jgi:hypothetical protein